ncbi:unnamed protein product [Pseudo-nitzschia multistriata]|uniref:Uncharacterized protein n=1 Tax=Pseudo-nitzschia multistriata TaxID=183589 RepID=A0A448Z2L9_9STRA|nr:unnamed protein product [Pseudo-nitzschia multistriata]
MEEIAAPNSSPSCPCFSSSSCCLEDDGGVDEDEAWGSSFSESVECEDGGVGVWFSMLFVSDGLDAFSRATNLARNRRQSSPMDSSSKRSVRARSEFLICNAVLPCIRVSVFGGTNPMAEDKIANATIALGSDVIVVLLFQYFLPKLDCREKVIILIVE